MSALCPLRLAAPRALPARPGPQPGGRRRGPVRAPPHPLPAPDKQPQRAPRRCRANGRSSPRAGPGRGRCAAPPGGRAAARERSGPRPRRAAAFRRGLPAATGRRRQHRASRSRRCRLGLAYLCSAPTRRASPEPPLPPLTCRHGPSHPFVVLPPLCLLLLPSSNAERRKPARCRKYGCRNGPLPPPPPRRAAG